MEVLQSLRYSLYLIFHPFDGFWDLKHEKKGNLRTALLIVAMVSVTFILRRQLTGFILNEVKLRELNIIVEILSISLPFFLWCVANWCVTTLMDGEGLQGYSHYERICTYPADIDQSASVISSLLRRRHSTVDILSLVDRVAAIPGTSVVHQYPLTKTF